MAQPANQPDLPTAVRLLATLAITNSSLTRRQSFLVAHLSGPQSSSSLGRGRNASLLFALRAVAHSAESVQLGAAQSAALTAPTIEASKEDKEVKVAHGHRQCWSAATAPTVAVNTARAAKTAASPNSAGCVGSRLRLQCVQRLTLSLGNSAKALANPSLNRTFCGVGQLGFISFSPNCPTPQNAG